jgi:sugar lactone lactonase YvrE
MIGMRFMLFVALCIACPAAEISTLAGNGTAGFSEIQVNNPYGLALGPDGALYFCEIGNHCIRRLDLHTHTMTRVIGTGVKGNSGDGGVALMAEVNEPYEIRFDRAGNLFFVDMQSSVVRRVERNSGLISRVAGTGEAGFSGDGGLAVEAQFRQPHSIAFAPDGALLVCDIGNRRIRRIDLASGIITTARVQSISIRRVICISRCAKATPSCGSIVLQNSGANFPWTFRVPRGFLTRPMARCTSPIRKAIASCASI